VDHVEVFHLKTVFEVGDDHGAGVSTWLASAVAAVHR
jgi:hypothetical protein